MKKIILGAAFAVCAYGSANAQDFELMHGSKELQTQGENASEGDYLSASVKFYDTVTNLTNAPLELDWRIVEANLPFSWFISGVCDNIECRPTSVINAHLANPNAVESFNTIEANGWSQLQTYVYVPVNGDNGTGTVKIRVFNDNHSDTSTFVVLKNGTSVNTIKLNDNRVSLFPNPGNGDMKVYVNKELNARELAVYNILGSKVATVNIQDEISSVNTANFAAGNYFVKIIGQNGEVITSRKWMKQ